MVSRDGGEGGALSPTPSQQVLRQRVTPEPISRRGPKERWGEDLLEEVAREELRLSGLKTRFMNAALRKRFPSRTIEAIKGRRRTPKYRMLLASLCAPNPVTTPPGPSQSEEGTLVQPARSEAVAHRETRPTLQMFWSIGTCMISVTFVVLYNHRMLREIALLVTWICYPWRPTRLRAGARKLL